VEHATHPNRSNRLELTKWMESLKSYLNQLSSAIHKALQNHHPCQSLSDHTNAVSARLNHFLLSYLAQSDLFSLWKSAFLLDSHAKIWTRFPLVPSLVKPFHHLVQDIPFSDMIWTFEMTTNSNAFRTFSCLRKCTPGTHHPFTELDLQDLYACRTAQTLSKKFPVISIEHRDEPLPHVYQLLTGNTLPVMSHSSHVWLSCGSCCLSDCFFPITYFIKSLVMIWAWI
jgi:hypothetical protein